MYTSELRTLEKMYLEEYKKLMSLKSRIKKIKEYQKEFIKESYKKY